MHEEYPFKEIESNVQGFWDKNTTRQGGDFYFKTLGLDLDRPKGRHVRATLSLLTFYLFVFYLEQKINYYGKSF